VREALAWARPVVASYPYPHCQHATSYDALHRAVLDLKSSFEAGRWQPNIAGREWVLREFAPIAVLRGLEPYLFPRPAVH
jgi:hypothetical protein